jgi:glutamyl-tRNA reductase
MRMSINNNNSKTHIVVLGINHNSGNTELRDRLLFTGSKLESGSRELYSRTPIGDAVILSTCNRVEIYSSVEDTLLAKRSLMNFLSEFHTVSQDDFKEHLYYHEGIKAVEHLFRVVASLDSMIVGEAQILGQIKNAYQHALAHGKTGPVINKLFQMAIAAGKRVRAETGIGEGTVSIASAAVDLAEKILGQMNRCTAMIIGAGEMSKLTAKHLSAAGVKKIYFANRTRENAVELSEIFNGSPILLSERADVLPECDIVVSSTGAPHYLIHPEEIKPVMEKRKNNPIFLIDIAAPRDIHPDVGKLYNVFLYNIDDLSEVSQANKHIRTKEVEAAYKIINEEIAKFNEWQNFLQVQPALVSMRRHFEGVLESELKRYSGAMSGQSEETRKLILEITSSLTNKFLHTPTVTLKQMSKEEDGAVLIDSLIKLFALEKNP